MLTLARSRGFTLIELLVGIAIIAILAAILFPVFASAKVAAKKTACLSNARQIGMSTRMYLSDNHDVMPIFYAYNSQPPAWEEGHKGVEVLLMPYVKSKEAFKSPFDIGGPYTHLDVPGAQSYWQAYGSSYRFTRCMFSVVAGESTGNNIPYTTTRIVYESEIQFPSDTRIMRLEMFPFFSNKVDTNCSRYRYDCPPPNNYFRMWNPTGGTMIFADGNARHVSTDAHFDQTRVNPEGNRSGEPRPEDPTRTFYRGCD
jgi:prepilin-type N-terminal cleavage/methylation domain-containing protein